MAATAGTGPSGVTSMWSVVDVGVWATVALWWVEMSDSVCCTGVVEMTLTDDYRCTTEDACGSI